MRFDELIRGSMTVRDVRARYPRTAAVFESLGFRESCDDCALDVVARKYGLRLPDVLAALNEAAFGPLSGTAPGQRVQ